MIPLVSEKTSHALGFPDSYYKQFLEQHRKRRDFLYDILIKSGFKTSKPCGAYYMITKYPDIGINNDLEFAHYLVKEIGVAVVPGSSFYRNPLQGKNKVRFAFPKKMETLQKAGVLLEKLKLR